MLLRRDEIPPLYALTARRAELSVAEIVGHLVAGGARWIQYREKGLDDAARYRELQQIVASLPAVVRLFVNDRPDLAIACGADGVHLGDEDLPPAAVRRVAGDDLAIGFSTHSVEDALRAAEDPSVDYVAIGPIFRSRTKDVRAPLGLDPIRRIRARTEKPIVAIGGIDATNVAAVLDAGADSAAVIAALYEGGSIAGNVERILEATAGR
jgi:thiamine-phosphate pyrophosphorylase